MRQDHATPAGTVEDRPVVPSRGGRQGGHRLVRLHDAGHEHPRVREQEAEAEHAPPAGEGGRDRPDPPPSPLRGQPRHRSPERARDARDREREHERLPRGQVETDPTRRDRAELDRAFDLDQERHEEDRNGVRGRHGGAGDHPGAEAAARAFGEGPARSEQQPGGERRDGEERDPDLDRRHAARGQVRQPESADVELPLDHDGDVVERTEVQGPDPDRRRERVGRFHQEVRGEGRPDADGGDGDEREQASAQRVRPGGPAARPAAVPRGHDRAACASSATSVGVRPTRTPAASSASALACAVPLEPVMMAPA